MKKIKRDFLDRDEFERDMLIANVWCDECNAVNRGVADPEEYEINGIICLEGKCAQCGQDVAMTLDGPLVNR